MNKIFRLFCFHAVFLMYCKVYGEDIYENVIDIWAPELYSLYKEAFITDKKYLTRRMFKGDKQFMLHVQKLREVNGLKTHNLKVEQKSALRDSSTNILYINNPVEARLSNSFLTVEQFKNAMVKQVEKQKNEFKLYKNIHPSNKIDKKIKHPAKVNFGKLRNINVFTPVIRKKPSSTNAPTEYREKYETLFENEGYEITTRVYNIINFKEIDVWTEATTTATIEAKILMTSKAKSKHRRTTTITTPESTTEATTESATEATTEDEKQSEPWTDTTFKNETDASAEEITDESNYNDNQEETTKYVKSTVRTRLQRPYVFLGSENF